MKVLAVFVLILLIVNSHRYSQEEGVLIECMDACFGLSRKRSQGCGFATPKHQDLFFGDQNDVENFVDHYSELSVSEQVLYYYQIILIMIIIIIIIINRNIKTF